jgi:hypothetical protein
MKKLIASLSLTLASASVFADVVIDPPKKKPQLLDQPAVLFLGAGIIALGALFYVRYRRARNKS